GPEAWGRPLSDVLGDDPIADQGAVVVDDRWPIRIREARRCTGNCRQEINGGEMRPSSARGQEQVDAGIPDDEGDREQSRTVKVRPEGQERDDEQEPRTLTTCVGQDQPQKKYEERIRKALRPDHRVAEADDERDECPEKRPLSRDFPSNEKRAEKRKR